MADKLDFEFVKIPEGEFVIGSNLRKDRNADPDETPQHKLLITDYHMLRHPVTNEQYRLFVDATGHRPPLNWDDGKFPEEKADHPVTGVSFQDANRFCEWAAEEIGLPLRLPSEAEWEKAARGNDARLYPWGNSWETGRANTDEEKKGGTTPVGEYSPEGDSPYGVAEVAGNVQEWCLSLFGPYPYDPLDGREVMVQNPEARTGDLKIRDTGCTSIIWSKEASTDKSVIRGGSWRENKVQSRCAYRGWAAPLHRSDDTGFRCMYEAEG